MNRSFLSVFAAVAVLASPTVFAEDSSEVDSLLLEALGDIPPSESQPAKKPRAASSAAEEKPSAKTAEPDDDEVSPESASPTGASKKKKNAESSKKTASPSKKTAEPAKKTVEPAKKTAEPAKKTVEPAKKTAEPAKKTAEPAKQTAEPAKKTVEPARKTAPGSDSTDRPITTAGSDSSGRSTTRDSDGFFRHGAIIGALSGKNADYGIWCRLECDWEPSDWPFFFSFRGAFSENSKDGDASSYDRDVYGRYGYSYREYIVDYDDLTENRIGGSAALLWDPLHGEPFRIYAGVGYAFERVEWEASGTRTVVDHHSYGYHWWSGGYSHRYYRTSRSVEHFSEKDSENLSAVVLRGGLTLALGDALSATAEASYMPDFHEDSSETELRFFGSLAVTPGISLDALFEYRLEEKLHMLGIGLSFHTW